MARLEDSKLLKKLEVDILPATKIVYKPFFGGVDSSDGSIDFFGAKVYEFRDIFLDFKSTVTCKSEQDLKEHLKKIYNCDYLMRRSIGNFISWYENISRRLTEDEKKSIRKKFPSF